MLIMVAPKVEGILFFTASRTGNQATNRSNETNPYVSIQHSAQQTNEAQNKLIVRSI